MFSQLLSQPPIALNLAKAGLRFPQVVENVVMRALSKEPAKRYSDVLAFAADFCQAAAAEPEKESTGFVSKFTSMFRKRD
jgi:hypothetical protein